MNWQSLSLTMFPGTPHNLTFLKNNWAVICAKRIFGVGINIAYFENLLTMRTTSNSPTLEKWVMKSREALFHDLVGMGKNSGNFTNFALSTLSCWQMRLVMGHGGLTSDSFQQGISSLLTHVAFVRIGQSIRIA